MFYSCVFALLTSSVQWLYKQARLHCGAREPSFRYATKNIARRWPAKHAFVDAEHGLKRRSPYKMMNYSQIAILFYVNNTVEGSRSRLPYKHRTLLERGFLGSLSTFSKTLLKVTSPVCQGVSQELFQKCFTKLFTVVRVPTLYTLHERVSSCGFAYGSSRGTQHTVSGSVAHTHRRTQEKKRRKQIEHQLSAGFICVEAAIYRQL